MAEKKPAKQRSADKIKFKQTDPDYHYNDDLIEYFEEILEIYRYIGDGRRYGYEKAIRVLKKIDHPLLEGSDGMRYYNIGESMSQDIDDFISGKKPRLESLMEKHPDNKKHIEVLRELMKVHGIGPAAANKLYDKGARTIEDLSKHQYYNLLNQAQQLGLRYYEESTKRIPRNVMVEYDKIIHKSLKDLFVTVQLAGSYRRAAPTSGDIDVMIVSEKITLKNMNKACNKLIKDGIIIEEYLAKGPNKFMGYTTQHHRIDIRFFTPSVYPAALLHLTGSDVFNKKMRQRAIDLGMRLSEYALTYYDGSLAQVTMESSIFAALFVEYIEPEDRGSNVKLVFTKYEHGLE